MTIEIGWINVEETVAAFSFRSEWTGADFHSAINEFAKLLQEKPYAVHVIIDLSYSISPPKSVMTLFSSALKKLPPNIEQGIIISKSNFWPRVFHMLDAANLVPFPLHYVSNADKALEILDEYLS